MKELESDKLYSILVNIYYLDLGQPRGTSPMKSIIITGDSNVTLIGQNIYNALIRANNEYSLPESETMVQIIWRPWLADEDYTKLVEPLNRTQIVNEVLREEANLKLDSSSKIDKINKIICGPTDKYENYLGAFPHFDSITKLELLGHRWWVVPAVRLNKVESWIRSHTDNC